MESGGVQLTIDDEHVLDNERYSVLLVVSHTTKTENQKLFVRNGQIMHSRAIHERVMTSCDHDGKVRGRKHPIT